MSTIEMSRLMADSGVKFGTSGARGLVTAMTDRVCYAFAKAFLQSLSEHDGLVQGTDIGIAGDLRPSTGRIMAAVARACIDCGHRVVHCGRIPTPAVALFGIERGIPTIMVTGSHIPDDRNGIKFHKASGEILKEDELAIRSQVVELPELFDAEDALLPGAVPAMPEAQGEAERGYVRRFLDSFPAGLLKGKRIVVYEHSAVGRKALCQVLAALGAEIITVGETDKFIPVDTEAIRPEDVDLALAWAKAHKPFAIVSTDGDSDRPLVADEHGHWLRGDVIGILCAQFAQADIVVTPVSSNTAVERCGLFSQVVRTRIGSPYVIEQMRRFAESGARCVVGYEANGGFLTASSVKTSRGSLSPLPTRDSFIVILSVLSLATEKAVDISALPQGLPARFTASRRLADFPSERGIALVEKWTRKGKEEIDAVLATRFGKVQSMDVTDGLRLTFESGDIAHLRPSGNAPELRCYAEAETAERAEETASAMLGLVRGWDVSSLAR